MKFSQTAKLIKICWKCFFYVVAILGGLSQADADAQGTVFTYQGLLSDNGSTANGSYDFRFRLATDSLGSAYIGVTNFSYAVSVANGLFTANIDFGNGVFNGASYWLEVDVRTNDPANTNAYTALSPLQPLTSAPYAIMANSASNLLGSLSASQLTGSFPAQLSGTVPLAQLPPELVTNNLAATFTEADATGTNFSSGSGITNIFATWTNIVGPFGEINIFAQTTNYIGPTGFTNIATTNGVCVTNVIGADGLRSGTALSVATDQNEMTMSQRLPGYFNWPVISFRPNTANENMAIDFMPNGAFAQDDGYGYVWQDICDADCLNSQPQLNCIHLSAGLAQMKIWDIQYNDPDTIKPFWFGVGSDTSSPAMVITPWNQVIFSNNLTVTGIMTNDAVIIGGLPNGSVTAGPGAGASPTVSVTGGNGALGADWSGQITITTGTAPIASAAVVTYTYQNSYPFGTTNFVVISPANATAGGLTFTPYTVCASNSFTIRVGGIALARTTTYVYNYK